jgi:hypothetical protein
MGFTCNTCGKWHPGLTLDYSYDAPHYWSSEFHSDPDCFLNSDLCVIKKEDYFVRGAVQIPIIGSTEMFCWGVWTTLSKKNFDRAIELSEDPKLLEEPPYFGWLSNAIAMYPETLRLKTNVQFRTLGKRPSIVLEPTDHPLAVEQRLGISKELIFAIAEHFLHSR